MMKRQHCEAPALHHSQPIDVINYRVYKLK